MNQFKTNYHFNSMPNNFLNPLSPFHQNQLAKEMDNNNFWCHDVPDNMPKAFNIVKKDSDLNDSNPLFRFAANTSLPIASSNLNKFSSGDLNSTSFNSSFTDPQSPLNSNWKTQNNLSTASSLIAPYKRKSLIDEDDLVSFQPPNKQNATEEKVIGKFNKLTIDEEIDLDEFIPDLDNDEIIDEDLNELDANNENVVEFATNDEDKSVHFELSEEVQEIFNCNDVITKLVQDQRDKESKALVLWQPRNNLASIFDKENKKSKELIDQTNEYTVTEESDNEDSIEDRNINLEDDYFKLSPIEITDITEINDLDLAKSSEEDMMELEK